MKHLRDLGITTVIDLEDPAKIEGKIELSIRLRDGSSSRRSPWSGRRRKRPESAFSHAHSAIPARTRWKTFPMRPPVN